MGLVGVNHHWERHQGSQQETGALSRAPCVQTGLDSFGQQVPRWSQHLLLLHTDGQNQGCPQGGESKDQAIQGCPQGRGLQVLTRGGGIRGHQPALGLPKLFQASHPPGPQQSLGQQHPLGTKLVPFLCSQDR